MSFPALKDAQGRLEAIRADVAGVLAEMGPDRDVKNVKSMPAADVVAHIRSKNDEMTAIAQEIEGLKGIEAAAANVKGFERGAEAGEREEADTDLGGRFLKSAAFKGRNVESHVDVELKDVFNSTAATGTGWQPETTRTGKLVESVYRPVQVTDLIPVTSTSQQAVVYMTEDTFTNNAAETGESTNVASTTQALGLYPEQAFTLREATSPVRKLAVWLPVTDEQLEDESGVRGYLNRRLPLMLRLRLDSQILSGNGTAPNLKGLLNAAGIQTQAKGTDPAPDAIYKALVKVRVTGRATPGAVIMHSTDWQGIRLLRTADGVYIWGSPSDSAAPRIWGLPVVENEVISAGTALVGDYANYSELAVRRGLDVQVSNSHSTMFVEGKQAIRADMRTALVVYRDSAFCKVTGL